MRAFYDPPQALHDPQQYMRIGRIIAPKDVPERTTRLLKALSGLGIATVAPGGDVDAARMAVHTAGFLRYLSTAWERWQELPDRGPEVWPNTFPYWSGRPEDRARPECPAEHIIAQTGWYLGDLSHHGDGTQQIFYSRPDVLTISIHADPVNYYPFFTGYEGERGIAAGEGRNLNLPLAHGSRADAMFAAVDRAAEVIRVFNPQAIVVALGFDAHARDPIGVLKLESDDFAGIGERVKALGLPTLVVQEGGYAIDAIGDCLTAFLTAVADLH